MSWANDPSNPSSSTLFEELEPPSPKQDPPKISKFTFEKPRINHPWSAQGTSKLQQDQLQAMTSSFCSSSFLQDDAIRTAHTTKAPEYIPSWAKPFSQRSADQCTSTDPPSPRPLDHGPPLYSNGYTYGGAGSAFSRQFDEVSSPMSLVNDTVQTSKWPTQLPPRNDSAMHASRSLRKPTLLRRDCLNDKPDLREHTSRRSRTDQRVKAIMDEPIPVPTVPAQSSRPHDTAIAVKHSETLKPATSTQSGTSKTWKERNVRFTKEDDTDIIDALTSKDAELLRKSSGKSHIGTDSKSTSTSKSQGAPAKSKETTDIDGNDALILQDLETLCRMNKGGDTSSRDTCTTRGQTLLSRPKKSNDTDIDADDEARSSKANQDVSRSQKPINLNTTDDTWTSKDEETLYKEATESDAVFVDSFEDDPDEVFQLIGESDCEDDRQTEKKCCPEKSRKGYENGLDDVSWQIVGYTGL